MQITWVSTYANFPFTRSPDAMVYFLEPGFAFITICGQGLNPPLAGQMQLREGAPLWVLSSSVCRDTLFFVTQFGHRESEEGGAVVLEIRIGCARNRKTGPIMFVLACRVVALAPARHESKWDHSQLYSVRIENTKQHSYNIGSTRRPGSHDTASNLARHYAMPSRSLLMFTTAVRAQMQGVYVQGVLDVLSV